MLAPLVAAVAVAVSLAGAASVEEPSSHIVGGVNVPIEDFPWQVSVQIRHHIGYFHYCGGSIVTKSCVLTAAHCINDFSNYHIRAGSSEVMYGGWLYEVIYKKRHERYNSPAYNNDVGVMMIRGEFTLGKKVQQRPIVAWQRGSRRAYTRVEEIVRLADYRPSPGTWVTVSGWGTTLEGGSSSNTLRAVTVKVIARSECQFCYWGQTLTDRMLCAGVTGGGKDACQGDSGGPLVHGRDLVGVVSFGLGCARPDYPGVYADVVSLRDWIKRNAGTS